MAIRQIRVQGDEVLEKVCRPVKEITPRIATLIEDMIDTMYEYDGVGLAAPQVGILRRIAVIDIGEGPIVLVNPEVIETSGEQTGEEGCLSLPGKCVLSMKIWKNMKWKVKSFWQELCCMRLIIWMVICIPKR